MEYDTDQILYAEFKNGNNEAFELLYNKYKKKIEYFIYNIIKDYQKAEDLAQETFIYIMKHGIKENCSFKGTIYLIAKSKAFNYIKLEKRKNEIEETYLNNTEDYIENDFVKTIEIDETKRELLQTIELLEPKFKNAIYLVNIEGLSYEETANILGQSLQNTKNLIHRGKKKLRNILLKKGFDNMNKTAKIMLIIICILLVSGVSYGITLAIRKFTYNNIIMNPTYESELSEHTVNNVWVGTLDLAWKELEEELGVSRIQIEGNDIPQMATDLNASTFSKEMLNEKDYEIKLGKVLNGQKINATLNKELTFLEPFDNFMDIYRETFGDGTECVKYFGINGITSEKAFQNVEVLFYSPEIYTEFAIKLKTKEGDEIILYRTDNDKNFEDYYDDIKNKTKSYIGEKEFIKGDRLQIPYIKINGAISYDELLGKKIKNSNGRYFSEVTQNVKFYLTEKGCNLSSRTTLADTTLGSSIAKYLYFKDKFVLFMKEREAEYPYFALKVDNDDILEKIDDQYIGPAVLDLTTGDYEYKEANEEADIKDGRYKFYEDENYKYYYSSHKTDYVVVSSYPYDEFDMTAEEALKEGVITIDVLDRYGIEYIKKKK